MLRFSSCSRAFALACLGVALSAGQALAHCFVGARFFPATLATDARVAILSLKHFLAGGDPGGLPTMFITDDPRLTVPTPIR